MARPIWKGQLSFGLVSIPVVLQSAESRVDLHFTLLDSRDHSRIRYERVNEETGEEVPWDQIVKGFEYQDGSYVVLDESDFKRAAVEATRTVEIEDFVALGEVSPAFFDKPYYLLPGKGGEKGYTLLREALSRTGRIGIAKVVIRTRQYLAAVIPQDLALMLVVLRFRQEVREFAAIAADALPALESQKAAPKELALAEQLISAMTSKWEPEKYHDDYRDALMKWIEQKARAGGKSLPTPEEPGDQTAPPTYNFIELLRKSVEEAAPAKARQPAARAGAKKSPPQKRRKAG